MDNKPILTYAGDVGLFTSLAPSLVQALPQECSEWRRSYGRIVKSVKVEATFVPFSKEILPQEGDWQLIKQPIFHVYWTECLDVDVYKTSVRDDIESWLKTLNQSGIQDWLIVLVETYDIRKSNKLLPRTTVIDKIRSDFATKHGDRCISVINPIRSESRSAESWRGLLARIRLLVLSAYNRTLLRFEEAIREQRERRNEPGWCFSQYFLLQEEMAFVLEMLGVYDEALVQYDELDALFTQFVLNSNVGETAVWLSTFQCPFDKWAGLTLGKSVDNEQREMIKQCKASLLEFRSYLFSRQCAMLLLTLKPWEIAQRSLPFLHNCCKELGILEIACPAGALACWVFLCCLEVLHTCQTFNDTGQVEAYSLFTASLWAYARDKLRELGDLCGLMPGREPTSAELHLVVGLSSGMGDRVGPIDNKNPTPTDKLKEALSSKEAFKKHYLELAELAMGTYKHIGRLRSARLIGLDLASFYLQLGETQKASVFLADAANAFEEENWKALAVETQMQLADCYKRIPDNDRFVKACAVIASSPELSSSQRDSYYAEMMITLRELKTDKPLLTSMDDSFQLVSLQVVPETGPIIEDSEVGISVALRCCFPVPVTCTRAALSLDRVREDATIASDSGIPAARPHEGRKKRPQTSISSGSGDSSELPRGTNEDVKPVSALNMVEHFDYNQDRSLSKASMVSRNPKQFLQRTDSVGKRKKNSPTRCDFTTALTGEGVTLKPGTNNFTLTCKALERGLFRVGQLSLVVSGKLEFLSNVVTPTLSFRVVREPSSVSLNKGDKDLLAGLMQEMVLTVSTGSAFLDEKAVLRVQTSRGLQMREKSSSESLSRDLSVLLPRTEPFNAVVVPLDVLAELPPQKDTHMTEHKVTLVCPWSPEEKVIPLHFQPPLTSTLRLHTAHTRKFVQVLVVGVGRQALRLMEPALEAVDNRVGLTPLNPKLGQPLVIGNGLSVSFLWQLDVGTLDGTAPIKTEFTMKYSPAQRSEDDESDDAPDKDNQSEFRLYKCPFDITNYKTLYVVKTRVEPTKGSEFCRAGTMSHLQLSVESVDQSLHISLMYEVLADQAMWAVCGRTAGVISLETMEKASVTLDVMPLIGGFLPLPLVRLSKYIPAAETRSQGRDTSSIQATSHPRLEPFGPGQVYNSSKSQQVHVLPSASATSNQDSLS